MYTSFIIIIITIVIIMIIIFFLGGGGRGGPLPLQQVSNQKWAHLKRVVYRLER